MFKFALSKTQKDLLERNIIEITDEKIEGETFYYVREALLQLTARGISRHRSLHKLQRGND